jgi:glycosyltransferase involved in cell wall biosynthesis
MSILEAMSAGCVIISSNISGCAEIVGDCGLLVKPKDSSDIRKKITTIIKSKEIESSFVAKSLDRAKKYSWNCLLVKYSDVI